jgi:splicing factor U2AF subunit
MLNCNSLKTFDTFNLLLSPFLSFQLLGLSDSSLTFFQLMEIVSVFGPLKAYRFVSNNDLNQRCAFLEYTDGSVTLKACAGLNGMRLGGSVITAVCAFPDASSVAVIQ